MLGRAARNIRFALWRVGEGLVSGITLGADKGYDTREFVASLRGLPSKFQGSFQLHVLVTAGFQGADDAQPRERLRENVIATQTRVRMCAA